MLEVFVALALGLAAGWLLRRRRELRHAGKALNAVIWIMVFLLGIEIGSNGEIMSKLGTVGLEATVIALFAVAGSVLASSLLYKKFFSDER